MKIWIQLNMSPLLWMVTDDGELNIKNLEI
jgi:hypothetical protein